MLAPSWSARLKAQIFERGGTVPGGGWTLPSLDDDHADWLAFLSQINDFCSAIMSLVLPEAHQQFQVLVLAIPRRDFLLIAAQHILRLLNTNVDGKRKVMYALTEIKGVGRRYSNIVCKKADVDLNKRCVFSSCFEERAYLLIITVFQRGRA